MRKILDLLKLKKFWILGQMDPIRTCKILILLFLKNLHIRFLQFFVRKQRIINFSNYCISDFHPKIVVEIDQTRPKMTLVSFFGNCRSDFSVLLFGIKLVDSKLPKISLCRRFPLTQNPRKFGQNDTYIFLQILHQIILFFLW